MITSPSSNVSLSIAPQSPYSGKDIREIMTEQVRRYDEVLSRLDRSAYSKALSNEGLRFSSIGLSGVERLKSAPLEIHTSFQRLNEISSRSLYNAHTAMGRAENRHIEPTMRDREIAEHIMFGIPHQTQPLEQSTSPSKLDYYASQEFAYLKADIKQRQWAPGIWNLPEYDRFNKDINYSGIIRPIYGALNVKGSLDGPAPSYGDVIIQLCDEVKDRATYTVGDTFDFVAGVERYGSVRPPLATHNNLDLLGASEELQYMLKGQDEETYIEAQIFGTVKFSSDIKSIRIPKGSLADYDYKKFMRLIQRLDSNRNIDWQIYDNNGCVSPEEYYKEGIFKYFNIKREIAVAC